MPPTAETTKPNAADAGTRHRLTAFGLSLDSDWPLPGSWAEAPSPVGAAGVTRVRRLPSEEFEAMWARPSELVFKPQYPDGKARVVVERSKSHYLLWFDAFGRFTVRIDGEEVACEAAGQRVPQTRILFAQVLPLAAVLRGFEPLHGSAVAAGGDVAAFIGPSGIGKTTLASRLVMRGATLVTDDVLTLKRAEDRPMAYPGAAMMVLSPDDASPTEMRRLGPVLGQTDKVHVSVPTLERARPLKALYYLQRSERFAVTALGEPDVPQILGAGFVPYLTTPGRLRRHLETAQLLSGSVEHFRLQVPRIAHFDAVLDSIETHLEEATRRC